MVQFGFWSLIPALSVIALALLTRRTLEALIAGALIGFVILKGTDFFSGFVNAALKVMRDPSIGWIILVCGLFGSLIALLVRGGGAMAFGNWLSRYVKGKRSALIATWLLGLMIAIDDYLIALTVSTSMKKVTDRFKVPREMLGYTVASTAAPVCVLTPISTWAVYVAGLLEANKIAAAGHGTSKYIASIPFMFYDWCVVTLVPLAAIGVIPTLGRLMRKAQKRAESGTTIPPGGVPKEAAGDEIAANAKENPRLINFILPIGALVGATWYCGINALKGVFVALAITIVMLAIQKIMTLPQIFDTAMDGFKTMILPLGIVAASFVLKEANDGLGLTNFVIDIVKPLMNSKLLPVISFLSLSLVTFTTGSFWGVYAIAIPIVIPLAQAMHANQSLTIAAVVSSGAFGSHACFFGDAMVLTATGSGCSPLELALAQLPYALLAATMAAMLFLTAGFIF